MKLEIQRERVLIVPESTVEIAYLEEVLNGHLYASRWCRFHLTTKVGARDRGEGARMK